MSPASVYAAVPWWTLRTLAFLGAVLTAACQLDSQGNLVLTSPGTPGAASGEQAPERISKDFYLPFYDQGDHLKSLVDEGNVDAAARLYGEQKAFFAEEENKKKYGEVLARIAGHFNDKAAPAIGEALQKLDAVAWPAPAETWPDIRQAIAAAEAAVNAYPKHELLKKEGYRAGHIDQLEARVKNIKDRIIQGAASEFAAFNHFGTMSFFAAFPVTLDATAFVTEHFPSVRERLRAAASVDLRQFATHYPKDILGKDLWGELGGYFVQSHLRESPEAKKNELAAVLSSVRAAKEAGFEPSKAPDLKIALVEVTSHTLLKQGGIEFPASVEVDLPIDAARADLDQALTNPTASAADYVIVFDVALAKASRRVTDTTKVPSRVITGYRTMPNPQHSLAQSELNQAQMELQSATIEAASVDGQACYGMGCLAKAFAQMAGAAAKMSARDKVNEAMAKLRNTPVTVDEPVYAKYQFDKASVKGTKTMTVHYYVIDKKRKNYFKSTFDIVERKTFEVIYNVHSEDPDKGMHLASAQREEDVVTWEEASASVKLSQLVEHYLRHTGIVKPLPDLVALRQEMLRDKNKALAKFESQQFDARPLNDPRFDHVVVVYVSAKSSLGSGFFVTPDVVLTNWHVVQDKTFVEMKMYDKQETFGKVIAKDVRLDLALVKVQSRGKPVQFYTGKTLDLGKTVEAIGHPRRLEFSITRGVISAVRRHDNINLVSQTGPTGQPTGGGKSVLFIQTDAPINPGNSGGPLFLGDKVIGVNTWGHAKKIAEGLNFAVHYSEVLEFLREHLPGYQATATQ
jgi:serine protease Do